MTKVTILLLVEQICGLHTPSLRAYNKRFVRLPQPLLSLALPLSSSLSPSPSPFTFLSTLPTCLPKSR